MAAPPTARRSKRAQERSFDSRESFLPQMIELHSGHHVAEAILGDFAVTTLFEQSLHVHAGNAVSLGRFDAERLAIEIQIELSCRAVTSAHAVKRQLLGQITVRIRGKTIAEPILARDRNVQLSGAEIKK